jgi:hypothetical protein
MMTPADARFLNIRENTAREDLGSPDLCRGIALLKKEVGKMTQALLGQQLSISQAYAGKMLDIADNVEPEFLDAWRKSYVTPKGSDVKTPKSATVEQMSKLAKTPRAEQAAMYATFAEETGKGARGPGAWKETVKANAKEQGTLFGRLVKLGAIAPLGSDFFPKFLGLLITIPERAGRAKKEDGTDGEKAPVTEEMKQEFYREARDAYSAALKDEFVWPPIPKPAAEPKAAKQTRAELEAELAELRAASKKKN